MDRGDDARDVERSASAHLDRLRDMYADRLAAVDGVVADESDGDVMP
jgi:hypothetical protein